MPNNYQKNVSEKNTLNKYHPFLKNLVFLSVNGLREMYLPARNEFAEKKKKVNDKIILTGINDRYTLINLIGLHKSSIHGFEFGIDLNIILQKQIDKCQNYKGLGEIGLLLWAAALISPEDIDKILTKINLKKNLENYQEYQLKQTMELSWLLTGILMASTFNKNFKESIGSLHHNLYEQIRNNYCGNGIFRHQDDTGLQGILRGNIASFADQVYPIYAFSLYSHQKENKEALLIAVACAQKVCELQGENGEWYWHYNSDTGKVVSRYPIYSVHQDAMAPMALFAVQKASNINFEHNIFKGLDWLLDQKCVDSDMICAENNLIWRAVTPQKRERQIKATFNKLGLINNLEHDNIELVEECWSYHLGWLLYAFSGRLFEKQSAKNDLKSNKFKLYTFNKN